MTERSLRPRDWIVGAAVAVVVAACAGHRMVPGVVGVFHDDAIYVATAKALAQGEGYRLVNLPDAPPQTKYPPLYPMALAAVWLAWPDFPDNLAAMQWLSVLCGAAFFGLAYCYLVRFGYTSSSVALAVCLLCGTAPQSLYISTLTLSEMPFALTLLGGLWHLERALARNCSPWRQVLTGLIVALPFAVRTIGLTFMAAALALLVVRRRPMGRTAAAALSVPTAWAVWIWLSAAPGPTEAVAYYTDYAISIRDSGTTILKVAGVNTLLAWFWTGSIPLGAAAELVLGSAGRAWLPLGLVGAAACLGLLRSAILNRPLAWSLLAYAAAVAVWPWPPWRFLVPVLPLLLAEVPAAVRDLKRLGSAGRTALYVALASAACAVTANLGALLTQTKVHLQEGYPSPSTSGAGVQWAEYQAAFTWIESNTDVDAVLAGGLDSMLFLYTGRRAVRPFPHRPASLFYGDGRPPVGTARELADFLREQGVSFLVQSPMPVFAEQQALNEAIAGVRQYRPDLLEPVYVGQDPRFIVFQVRRSLGP